MVSRFCIENRLSFLFLVSVHHTHVRCNLVRKLARTVFKLAIKKSPGGESAGRGRAVNFEIHLPLPFTKFKTKYTVAKVL